MQNPAFHRREVGGDGLANWRTDWAIRPTVHRSALRGDVFVLNRDLGGRQLVPCVTANHAQPPQRRRHGHLLPQFVGLTFGVYNGSKHIPVSVNEDMVGHKFGEFSPTRTYYGHGADKKAKRK